MERGKVRDGEGPEGQGRPGALGVPLSPRGVNLGWVRAMPASTRIIYLVCSSTRTYRPDCAAVE